MEVTNDIAPDLLRQRAAHMDNLKCLRNELPTLSAKAAQRAENTMANLMQQVYAIDAQLRINRKKPAQRGES